MTMKKNKWTLFLLVILGLLAGSLVSYWLDAVPGLSFLTNAITTDWSPSFDLHVISLDLSLSINVTLLSIMGMLAAIWCYRKL
jgi:hypothetical protein